MLKTCLNFITTLKVPNSLIYLFFVLSVISCSCTYALFSDVSFYHRNSKLVVLCLYCDISFILILILLGSNKIWFLLNQRTQKSSKLTLRLISIFSLLSVTPSILMCIFAAVFFHNGLESWFDQRNITALTEALHVAKSYVEEHQKNALIDCTAIARSMEYHISQTSYNINNKSSELNFLLDDLCRIKGVQSAILLNSSLEIIAYSMYSVNLHFLNIHYSQLAALKEKYGKSLIIEQRTANDNNIIAATYFKNADESMFLLIEKKIDKKVLAQAECTKNAFNEYHDLLQQRSSLEIAFIMMFLVVSVLLFIAAVSVATSFSWKLLNPITNLIDVSEEIINGNINAKAKIENSYDEINILSKTFNQMLTQVQEQQTDLVNINAELKERIDFTSSVLSGVSSGVIGINKDGIYIWNAAAEKLLNQPINIGDDIVSLVPPIQDMLHSLDNQKNYIESEIHLRINNDMRLFLVKIGRLSYQHTIMYVLTMDDLTDIARAQHKAAWSEVARRVAHEIKNPLTPIQLSAERILRKYSSQITKDANIFSGLIDVIIKQVGDIKRLIDEFNFFARLPNPIRKCCSLNEICCQAIFLLQNANYEMEFIKNITPYKCEICGDERLLHQAIVNLLQNAINALSTVENRNNILITLYPEDNHAILKIEDNGPGFPEDKLESLTTPYFTLMPKGTGLGLAIVKKIIQDHDGKLEFGVSSYGGAAVTITLPLYEELTNHDAQ